MSPRCISHIFTEGYFDGTANTEIRGFIMSFKWQYWLYLSLSAFLLSGCGLATPDLETAIPTFTPTPISTELPTIEPVIPPGLSETNPIRIVIVPADAEQAPDNVAELQSLLEELVEGVFIEVVLAETQAEAANAICSSDTGVLSAVWVSGMTYATVNLGNCGVASFQADTPEGTGQTGVILLPAEEEEEATEDDEEEQEAETITLADIDFTEATLCRLSVDDVFSWVVPVIALNSAGVDPVTLDDINEVTDNDELIADIQSGECAIGGMSEVEWESYLEADAEAEGTLVDDVQVVVTSPEIPYNVFAVPFATSADVVIQIENALLALDIASGRSEGDEDTEIDVDVDAELLDIFFGEGSFQQIANDDLTDFIDFVASSGINFPELRD